MDRLGVGKGPLQPLSIQAAVGVGNMMGEDHKLGLLGG